MTTPAPKLLTRRTALVLRLLCWMSLMIPVAPARATPGPVSDAERKQVIERALHLLQTDYVYPEVAARMATAVRERQQRGAYDALPSAEALCQQLTADLRAVSKDRHLRVIHSERPLPPDRNKGDESPAQRAEQLARGRHLNFGFERVERLPGNIGYLDLRFFESPDLGGATATAAMSLLSHSDALIIDLRRNIGGSPEMVALITSYLFDNEPVHLNDLYWRPSGATQQFWTLPYVPGTRLAGKDVYVLISHDTFSAGEEFANNLKVLHRATLIGEGTGGGAHPVERRRINDHFAIVVPSGRAINPTTGTNWEGVGVRPDIEVPAAQALAHARMVALERVVEKTPDEPLRGTLRQALDTAKRELDSLRRPQTP